MTDHGRTSEPPLGIFARVFPAQSAASLARTVHDLGFSSVQLNLVALGIPSMPTRAELDQVDLSAIRTDFQAAQVSVWGLSATYNMAHPDRAVRAEQTDRAVHMIARAGELGAVAVTLCTGTREASSQWKAHPDNGTQSAWDDMMGSFHTLISAAEAAGVMLGVEPEPANIVRGTDQAVRLLDDLGDRAAKVGFILDPANLVAGQDPSTRSAVLRDAFARLGPKTICVHAKDVVTWGERLAGAGGLDFGEVLDLHARLPVEVPVIIQDTEPDEAAPVRDLLIAAARAATLP